MTQKAVTIVFSLEPVSHWLSPEDSYVQKTLLETCWKDIKVGLLTTCTLTPLISAACTELITIVVLIWPFPAFISKADWNVHWISKDRSNSCTCLLQFADLLYRLARWSSNMQLPPRFPGCLMESHHVLPMMIAH